METKPLISLINRAFSPDLILREVAGGKFVPNTTEDQRILKKLGWRSSILFSSEGGNSIDLLHRFLAVAGHEVTIETRTKQKGHTMTSREEI